MSSSTFPSKSIFESVGCIQSTQKSCQEHGARTSRRPSYQHRARAEHGSHVVALAWLAKHSMPHFLHSTLPSSYSNRYVYHRLESVDGDGKRSYWPSILQCVRRTHACPCRDTASSCHQAPRHPGSANWLTHNSFQAIGAAQYQVKDYGISLISRTRIQEATLSAYSSTALSYACSWGWTSDPASYILLFHSNNKNKAPLNSEAGLAQSHLAPVKQPHCRHQGVRLGHDCDAQLLIVLPGSTPVASPAAMASCWGLTCSQPFFSGSTLMHAGLALHAHLLRSLLAAWLHSTAMLDHAWSVPATFHAAFLQRGCPAQQYMATPSALQQQARACTSTSRRCSRTEEGSL